MLHCSVDPRSGGETTTRDFLPARGSSLRWHSHAEYAVLLRGKIESHSWYGPHFRFSLVTTRDPSRTNHGWETDPSGDAFLRIRRAMVRATSTLGDDGLVATLNRVAAVRNGIKCQHPSHSGASLNADVRPPLVVTPQSIAHIPTSSRLLPVGELHADHYISQRGRWPQFRSTASWPFHCKH